MNIFQLILMVLISMNAYADHIYSNDKDVISTLRAKNNNLIGINEHTKSLVDLIRIFNGNMTISEVIEYHKNNDWVPICSFRNEIEKRISFDDDTTIKRWFNLCKPITQAAKFLNNYAAITIKPDVVLLNNWSNQTELSFNFEDGFYNRYKSIITKSQLQRKVNNLIWANSLTLAEYYNSKTDDKNIAAKIKFAKKAVSYETLVKKHPILVQDEFIKYKRINQLFKNDENDAASRLFFSIKNYSNHEAWWKPRHIIIRQLIQAKNYSQAYKLATNHSLVSGENFQDAEWIAGWIAFRKLNNPKKAVQHFQKAFDDAQFATSKSKASYWLMRSYSAIGDKKNFDKWLDITASHKAHFYGQLAIYEHKKSVNLFNYKPPKELHFEPKSDKAYKLLYSAYLLDKSGYNHRARALIKALPPYIKDDDSRHYLLNYLLQKKEIPLCITLAKQFTNQSNAIFAEGYPNTISITNNANAKAIYLAIIRQESNFDQNAVSPAGAHGLMQLITPTAHRYAKILKLPLNSFKTNRQANVAKGVYYLDSLINQFGNIIPAIAAYNAGEGAVAKWLVKYGDVSCMKYEDKIDWIEMIPYGETRLYVKKVLENMFVYEMLSNPQKAKISF